MVGISSHMDPSETLARYWSNELACSLVCGAVFAMPAWDWIRTCARGLRERLPEAWRATAEAVGLGLQLLAVVALLLISGSWLAGGTYNPFIYFRF